MQEFKSQPSVKSLFSTILNGNETSRYAMLKIISESSKLRSFKSTSSTFDPFERHFSSAFELEIQVWHTGHIFTFPDASIKHEKWNACEQRVTKRPFTSVLQIQQFIIALTWAHCTCNIQSTCPQTLYILF